MLAAATGRSSHAANTRSGSAPSSARDHRRGERRRHRSGVGLQRGERLLGLVGQPLGDEADELADLHQHALHLAQLLGDVLGGADGELLVELGAPFGGRDDAPGPVPAKRLALRAVMPHIRRDRQDTMSAEPAPHRGDERPEPDAAGGDGGGAGPASRPAPGLPAGRRCSASSSGAAGSPVTSSVQYVPSARRASAVSTSRGRRRRRRGRGRIGRPCGTDASGCARHRRTWLECTRDRRSAARDVIAFPATQAVPALLGWRSRSHVQMHRDLCAAVGAWARPPLGRRRRVATASPLARPPAAILLLAPSAVILGVFVVYPLGRAMWLGQQRCDVRATTARRTAGTSTSTCSAASSSSTPSGSRSTSPLITVPLGLVLGVGLAVLADKYLRGIGAFRTIFSSTVATSVAVASLMWLFLLQPSVGALANIGWFSRPLPGR